MSDQLTDEQVKRLRDLAQNNRLREVSPDVRFMFLDALDELLQLRQNVYLIADEGGGLVTVERVSDADVARRIADLEAENAALKEVALAFVNLPEIQELSAIAFKREILSIAAKTGKAPITVQGWIEGGEYYAFPPDSCKHKFLNLVSGGRRCVLCGQIDTESEGE